jgi:hypothetical protein
MRRMALLVLGLVSLAAFTGSSPGALPSKPDLYIEMPTKPYNDHVAPVFVDAFTIPGHLLYRFDTIVRNQGGTLDLYRDAKTGHVMQAIWPNGIPTTPPDPLTKPQGAGVKIEDRTEEGALMGYVVEPSHQHFHFQVAASYRLLVPGHAPRTMPKVGFCMHDTYGAAKYFDPEIHGASEDPWCAPGDPNAAFVRMGLSPGAGDLYDAATELQWVDINGLTPGHYTIKATANPRGDIDEDNRSNNTLSQVRLIPGILVSAVQVYAPPGAPVTIPLAATIVAPTIPARSSASCQPKHVGWSCYTRTTAGAKLEFALGRKATHGEAAISSTGRATYTPAATGTDTFTYTATDPRGLTSQPAAVTVTIASPARAVRSALVRISGATATAYLQAATAADISARVAGRSLGARHVKAGSARIELGHFAPGRYSVRLVAGAHGSTQTITLPFVVP